MNPRPFAKATQAFGTSTTQVIIADRDPHRRLMSISLHAVDLLRRLVSAGGRGVEVSTLSTHELRALSDDIERKLGIRVRRSRKSGFIVLAGNVSIVDQRISNAEAA